MFAVQKFGYLSHGIILFKRSYSPLLKPVKKATIESMHFLTNPFRNPANHGSLYIYKKRVFVRYSGELFLKNFYNPRSVGSRHWRARQNAIFLAQ